MTFDVSRDWLDEISFYSDEDGTASSDVKLCDLHYRPQNISWDKPLDSTDQNNNITMTSEDLLQPGHVVKERWKVSHTKF